MIVSAAGATVNGVAHDLVDRLVRRGNGLVAELHVGHGPEIGACRSSSAAMIISVISASMIRLTTSVAPRLGRRVAAPHGVILRPATLGSRTVVVNTWRLKLSLNGPSAGAAERVGLGVRVSRRGLAAARQHVELDGRHVHQLVDRAGSRSCNGRMRRRARRRRGWSAWCGRQRIVPVHRGRVVDRGAGLAHGRRCRTRRGRPRSPRPAPPARWCASMPPARSNSRAHQRRDAVARGHGVIADVVDVRHELALLGRRRAVHAGVSGESAPCRGRSGVASSIAQRLAWKYRLPAIVGLAIAARRRAHSARRGARPARRCPAW